MLANQTIRIPSDPRGKIKSGEKTAKGLPKSLDYFNISKFPELVQAYGDKPAALVVFCPSDNIADFFDSNFYFYKRSKKGDEASLLIRKCDGEQCYHRFEEKIGSTAFPAGSMSECVCANMAEDDDNRCKNTTWFKMFVGIQTADGKDVVVDKPLPYHFETGYNSGINIWNALALRRSIDGKLFGVPFKLVVEMVDGKTKGHKFPIWNLFPLGTLSQTNDYKLAFNTAAQPQLPAARPPEQPLKPAIEQQLPQKGKKDKPPTEAEAIISGCGEGIKQAKTKTELRDLFKKLEKQKTKILPTDFDSLVSDMKIKANALPEK